MSSLPAERPRPDASADGATPLRSDCPQREARDVRSDGSGPHEAGGLERVEGNQHARTKADAPGKLSGSPRRIARISNRAAPMVEIADFRVERAISNGSAIRPKTSPRCQQSRDGFSRSVSSAPKTGRGLDRRPSAPPARDRRRRRVAASRRPSRASARFRRRRRVVQPGAFVCSTWRWEG